MLKRNEKVANKKYDDFSANPITVVGMVTLFFTLVDEGGHGRGELGSKKIF